MLAPESLKVMGKLYRLRVTLMVCWIRVGEKKDYCGGRKHSDVILYKMGRQLTLGEAVRSGNILE